MASRMPPATSARHCEDSLSLGQVRTVNHFSVQLDRASALGRGKRLGDALGMTPTLNPPIE